MGIKSPARGRRRADKALVAGGAMLAAVVIAASAQLSGDAGAAVMALVVLSAVLVALAQQTLP
jgi:hypothetical protein